MRILITGAGGMLGTDLRKVLEQEGRHLLATGVSPASVDGVMPLDVTDFSEIRSFVKSFEPDVVLHCAAYTNVDGCERDPELAYRINGYGTWAIAAAAEEVGAALVAVSTDFVFDGQKGQAYTEFDAPNPISSYGASKRAGEILALRNCRKTYIVRTSWLYGVYGKNFPYSMIALAKSKPAIPVVADQIGTPTYTVDLAKAIADLIETPLYGIYHISNAGQCSWADFARAILAKTGHADTTVREITSEQYAAQSGSPTRRPAFSALRHWALEMQGKDTLRPWEEALDDFVVAARAEGKL